MPEAFLYFFHRMLQHMHHQPQLRGELQTLLRERLCERIGVSVDPISLSMRLICLDEVGIRDTVGLQTLRSMQAEDGGWELGTMYQYASKKLRIGNRGVSTALAIRAIERCQHSN